MNESKLRLLNLHFCQHKDASHYAADMTRQPAYISDDAVHSFYR
jgi:hypothetical protein